MVIISDKNIENGKIISKDKIKEILKEKTMEIYEVIRTIDSKPLFLKEHINRFFKSIELAELEKIYDYKEINEMIYNLIRENDFVNNNIRITYFNNNKENRLLIYFVESSYPDKALYEKGINTVTVKKMRKEPNAKIFEEKLRSDINDIIKNNDAFEAIMVNEDNTISEGSRSNVFFVKDNKVITPKDDKVLLGVTREKILKICQKNNICVEKRNINIKELRNFSGSFITGTSINVLPILKLDNYLYNSASNQNIQKISQLFIEEIANELK